MDSDRCEDTSSMMGFALEVKPLRMMSSPSVGPRHTIDNILGLVRKEDASERERAVTPGNGESAGNSPLLN